MSNLIKAIKQLKIIKNKNIKTIRAKGEYKYARFRRRYKNKFLLACFKEDALFLYRCLAITPLLLIIIPVKLLAIFFTWLDSKINIFNKCPF